MMRQDTSNDKRIAIIGSGFGALGAAGLLAQDGYKVDVYEKNEMIGGRASVLKEEGYTFDMGPSWFMMLDVWEHYFRLLGEDMYAHLDVVRLSPSYRFFFKESRHELVDIFSDIAQDAATFEGIEKGAGTKLREYLENARAKYDISLERYVYRNYNNIFDFLTPDIMLSGPKLGVFANMQRHIERYFDAPELQKLMQYTMLFLGSKPHHLPALYSQISHADFSQGIYYPMGGMYEIVKALQHILGAKGVGFHCNAEVTSINVQDGKATGITLANGQHLPYDIVISNADLVHTERQLLEPSYRSERNYDDMILSPSAYICYLGVDGEIPEFVHHNFIAEKDWDSYFNELFDHPSWPSNPSLYICAPSRTDKSVAPAGKENLFLLMPLAAGLEDSPELREQYANILFDKIERDCGIKDFKQRIEYKKDFCVKDFESRYHSFKGNGLGGFSHTLRQSAFFRPNNYSKKVANLYFAGAGTNPGIGTMMALISGQNVYKRIANIRSAQPLEVSS